jgi:polyvinyl alcohol dehydrogenase (cytochrome)
VSASDGRLVWRTELAGESISASALVTGNIVVIGGLNGANLYGLNRLTGKIKWTTRLGSDSLSAIFGSPTKIRNYVAVGVASNEETATMDPTYECCKTRGSLALVDPKDGTVVWQT